MTKHRVTLTLNVRARTKAEAEEIGVGACEHLRETFNDDDSIGDECYSLAGTPAAEKERDKLQARMSAPLFALIWGGGDEPESPAITLHRSRPGALAQALTNIAQACIDARDVREHSARVRRELKSGDYVGELPNETWMEIQSLAVNA